MDNNPNYGMENSKPDPIFSMVITRKITVVLSASRHYSGSSIDSVGSLEEVVDDKDASSLPYSESRSHGSIQELMQIYSLDISDKPSNKKASVEMKNGMKVR